MIMLKGTIQQGQVILPHPANLPNGTQVTVLTHEQSLGIPDEEWPTDPEGIAQLLARMDKAEALETSAVEEADIEAWRQKVKDHTLAHQDRAIKGVFE
jgi:hypothetical protein